MVFEVLYNFGKFLQNLCYWFSVREIVFYFIGGEGGCNFFSWVIVGIK